jgi:hypothetical protein
MKRIQVAIGVSVLAILCAYSAKAQDTRMSFFITSVGGGHGGDLGGLDGADQHCQQLAAAVGAGERTWRAYLSTYPDGVNARDRIGSGPWYNAKGVMVARDLDHLHSDGANINKETALNERGETINGVGDTPNRHDIMTGSYEDGTAHDMNCDNWTNSGDEEDAYMGSTTVGHHDRMGRGGRSPWNSAHTTQGCSQETLRMTGGDGLFACFAID